MQAETFPWLCFRRGSRQRPALLWELATVAWLCWLYDLLLGATPLTVAQAVAHGRAVLAAERALGFDFERGLDRFLHHHHLLVLLASYYYDNAHFVVTFGLLALLWWRFPQRYRGLRQTLVICNVIAFVVFYLYPMAPPRLLPGAGFYDVVAESAAVGQWHRGPLAPAADQYAAMPSLHIAWSVWCTAAVFAVTKRWRWRAPALLYPFLTAFVVIATGNHLLIDVAAGVGTTGVAALPQLARRFPLPLGFVTARRKLAALVPGRRERRGSGRATLRPSVTMARASSQQDKVMRKTPLDHTEQKQLPASRPLTAEGA